MFQQEARHDGRAALPGPSSPRVTWTALLNAKPGTPALGADGTIYVPSGQLDDGNAGFLNAVTSSGGLKWRLPLAGAPSDTSPAVASDGTIYVHANGPANIFGPEHLYAVNPNGGVKWTFEMPIGAASDVESSPAVAPDGTIWVGSGNTRLYALNPNGTLRCSASPSVSSINSSPAIGGDGSVYVIDAAATLAAYGPACNPLWSAQLGGVAGAHPESPAIGLDGTIYVHSIDDNVYGVRSNGAIRCTFATHDFSPAAPAIGAAGTVYIGSDDGVHALTPDCVQKWRFKPPGFLDSVGSSPILDSNGTVFWRTDYHLYAITPTGKLKWQTGMDVALGGHPTGGALGAGRVLYWGDGGSGFGFKNIAPRLRAFKGRCRVAPKHKSRAAKNRGRARSCGCGGKKVKGKVKCKRKKKR